MYKGITGALKTVDIFGQYKTIAYISGWSVEDSTEMVDVTEFSSVNKRIIPGAKSWHASSDGIVSFEGENSQDILFDALNKGKELTFHFYLNDADNQSGNEESVYFCGAGYIESVGVELTSEDVGKISISVAGTGKLALRKGDADIASAHEEEKLEFSIEDGYLHVKCPDNFADSVEIVDDHLIIKL